MTDAAALSKTVSALASGRAAVVDPIGVAHLGRMLVAAQGLEGPARAVLLGRAAKSLESLVARIERSDARARARLDAADVAGLETKEARSALASGDTVRARRMADRDLRLGHAPRRHAPERHPRLAGWLTGPDAPARGAARSGGGRLGATVRRAETRLAVARAEAKPPTVHGRYHTESVVRDLLVSLEALAPGYLDAHVARLALFGDLERFVRSFEPPPQPEPATPPAKKRAAKSPRATGPGRGRGR